MLISTFMLRNTKLQQNIFFYFFFHSQKKKNITFSHNVYIFSFCLYDK